MEAPATQQSQDNNDPNARIPVPEPRPSAAELAATQTEAVPRPNREAGLSGQSEEVLMAMNLYAEGRGEYVRHGDDALYAIGRVVMNRARSRHFPGSPSAVILQRSQFSWTRSSDPNYAEALNPSNAPVWEACVRIARAVLGGGGGDPAPGADHYHASYVSPNWANRRQLVARIGAHLFYDLVSDDNGAAPREDGQDAAPRFRTPRDWTPAPELADIQRPQAEGGRVLRLGHVGPAVAAVQRLLSLEDDGYFGADTAEAVYAFKQGHGLGEAERVGFTTWTLLVEMSGGAAEQQGQGRQGQGQQGQGQGQQDAGQGQQDAGQGQQGNAEQPVFQTPRSWTEAPSLRALRDPNSGAVAQLGHFGPAVSEIQRLLMIKDDGYFGADTARIVYAFKQQHGLGFAEKVGYLTLSRLLEVRTGAGLEGPREQQGQQGQQGQATSGWTPAPSIEEVRAQTAVIDFRMEGEAVKVIQRLLLIGDDGRYGSGTQTAVRQFKAQHSLSGGDQVGWFTLQRMEEVAAERGNISQDSAAQMSRILAVARSRAGGRRPGGRCYAAVSTYIDAAGYGQIARGGFGHAIPAGYWSYARQFGEYLNQGNNAERLGIKRLGITNPYDAPAGAIVVVSAGSPGTSHPTAGDISIAGGDGTFYNDGNMSYRSKEAWPPQRGGVIGIYVPNL